MALGNNRVPLIGGSMKINQQAVPTPFVDSSTAVASDGHGGMHVIRFAGLTKLEDLTARYVAARIARVALEGDTNVIKDCVLLAEATLKCVQEFNDEMVKSLKEGQQEPQ